MDYCTEYTRVGMLQLSEGHSLVALRGERVVVPRKYKLLNNINICIDVVETHTQENGSEHCH